ncbi:hypothetical protein CPB85DRAFT_643945 [Mucidula mucida]|nr:hypothetical protein CPB85DRAFT_643945 [Mucidula mucida]
MLIMALIHMVIRAMSMGDMLVDIMSIHSVCKRPVRAPQSTVLPPELWNAILAKYQDRSTLLACSLVCSAWASISREHLHLKEKERYTLNYVDLGLSV